MKIFIILVATLLLFILVISIWILEPRNSWRIDFPVNHEQFYIQLKTIGYPDYYQIVYISPGCEWFPDSTSDYRFISEGENYFYETNDTELIIYTLMDDFYLQPTKRKYKTHIRVGAVSDSVFEHLQNTYKEKGLTLITF